MPASVDQLQTVIHRFRHSREPAEQVAGLLFERAAPSLLASFSPASLLALGEASLAFLAAPGEPKVRVYTPQLASHGWEVPFTVLELTLSDRPFIVDSVRAELKRQGCTVAHFLHPILNLHLTPDGEIYKLGDEALVGEQVAYELYFLNPLAAAASEALSHSVHNVLKDVILATQDFGALRQQTEVVAARLEALADTADAPRSEEAREGAAFIRWLAEDNFVFLGYREYDILEHQGELCLQKTPHSGLGILRKEESAYEQPKALAELSEGLRQRVVGGWLITVTKTNAEASVHRPVRMDYIGVKKVHGGVYVGEQRFVGLFTSKALSAPVEAIPLLRHKLKRVLALDGAEPDSHDYKQIVSLFSSVPRGELFWSDAERLQQDFRTVMAMTHEGGVRLTVRPDPLARGLAAMVIMPRDRFNASVRREVQAYLARELAATHTDYQLAMDEDEEQVRLHFFFVTTATVKDLEVGGLEHGIAALTRTWEDQLTQALVAQGSQAAEEALARRFLPLFDERYRADTRPETALRDVANLQLLAEHPFVINLLNLSQSIHASQQGLSTEASHLEVYHRGETLVLSDIMPLLENFGLRVVEQLAYQFATPGSETLGLDIFRVQTLQGKPLDVEQDGQRLEAALYDAFTGSAERDRLNGLVLLSGLNVRQVALLRALRMYYAQLVPSVSRPFIRNTLLEHPALAASLVKRFELKFAPAANDRAAQLAAAHEQFDDGLQEVTSLAEDEVLRGLANLIDAALRSNYFLDKPYISFKLESSRVSAMPEPRPLYEIAVSAPNVEGTHLRGGKVARGGLRWSDRPDDFRTEVLGLMKTQMTKNAVIVPVGSKGGFVLKNAPGEREALLAFVREQYQTYLQGLLDLTDNLVAGEVVHPEGLVIYDGADPYLVVAADKGTATFSDLANETAAAYDFWLGDAFASGGSLGYDHKAEGITARGAWESVKRHFFELGKDVLRESVSAFGIGDMSGDVFGNGMLYTNTLKLQAAFNHLHIFLDPDPDPVVSYAERQRLFALPRSSWEDYDKALISEGGGVYSRFAKRISLSPQVQRMLGTQEDALSGQDLIKAILAMPADLMWNGGVGTYVKAQSESHAEVGDSSNNAVRIDASALRVKVVGEGGNLGFTQLARVEFALSGGRINTDAVDNSAGVDMSDHEVNIKILLQALVAEQKLTFEARNALLKAMTGEVSSLVLKDNAQQALTLSLAQRRAARDTGLFYSLQRYLAERGQLRPEVEFLPSERTVQARSYTRPELAVLMAYTKMGLYGRLLETELTAEPQFQHYLSAYFPDVLRADYPAALQAHTLHREIIATQMTNTIVDYLGISFIHRTQRDTAASPAAIIRAGLLALELLDAPALFAAVSASGAPAEAQYEQLGQFTEALEALVAWLLLGGPQVTRVPEFIALYREPLAALRGQLATLLSAAEREAYEAQVAALVVQGFAPELAENLASLTYLPSVMGIIQVSQRTRRPLAEVAKPFYALGSRLSLGELRDTLTGLPSQNKWDKVALAALIMDFRRLQIALTTRYVTSGAASPAAFWETPSRQLKRYDDTLAEVQRTGELSLASASVLRRMVEEVLAEVQGASA